MRSQKRPVLAGNPAHFLLGIALGLCAAGSALADRLHSPTPHSPTPNESWQWQLPAGFPEPLVPANNPMTAAKVALGELLFVERGLSVNGKLSCADCHQPQNYFVDNVVRPTGALGETLMFNTPTLWNVAYSVSLSWIDKGLTELEQQHMGPLTNADPVELGTGPEQLAALSEQPELAAALSAAFPAMKVFDLDNVAAALASYLRTLIRADSAFDQYLFNDKVDALGAQAQAGLLLFTSNRLNCASCHRGFLLSGPTRSTRQAFPASFYQTGVKTLRASAPAGGRRVDEVDRQAPAQDAFRAPSLRFVSHTAPYMHGGSITSLDEVIDFYQRGGIPGDLGEKAAKRMRPFALTPAERRALLAFLRSL